MANRKKDFVTLVREMGPLGVSRRDFCLSGLATLAFADCSEIMAQAITSSERRLVPESFDRIEVAGDLAQRASQNYDRLESDIYQPPLVFESGSVKVWPGDWEGRTVLGLTLLSRSTHREARYLDEILRLYPAKMNGQGYFGPPLDPEAVDEQQLSGHGWVLRGLCEYYEWMLTELLRIYNEYGINNVRAKFGVRRSAKTQNHCFACIINRLTDERQNYAPR